MFQAEFIKKKVYIFLFLLKAQLVHTRYKYSKSMFQAELKKQTKPITISI